MKSAAAVILLGAALVLLGELRGVSAPKPFAPHQSKGAWLAASGTAPLDGPSALVLIERIKQLGADGIALGPDVLQPHLDAPELEWGRDDDALRFVLRAARTFGLKTFVMPRVESPDFFKPPYPWRGTMTFERPEVRAAWYENYRRMIVHYGRLCAEEGVTTFGIGLEYRKLVTEDPKQWRRVAEAARGVFGGTLVYSANWDDYERIAWWDAVDVVGIGAYFEIIEDGLPDGKYVDTKTLKLPDLSDVMDGWKPIRAKLEAFSASVARPILFTEVGYTRYADTCWYPWRWQAVREERPEQQALAYRALMRTFAGAPWWAGVYVWRFYTRPEDMSDCRYRTTDRSEHVLRDAWSRDHR